MTIADIIGRVDALKPNKFNTAQKIAWLSDTDSAIFRDIICTHTAGDDTPESFDGYASDVDLSTVLLVTSPHDVLYRYALEMQIDLTNGEYAKYNNSARLYNEALSAYSAWYNRMHTPKQAASHFTY